MAKILITGAAGFIGFHVSKRFLDDGAEVYGVDNINSYYDPTLKLARLEQLQGRKGFTFERVELADRAAVEALFKGRRFDRVVHLAAQAGVRYSIGNPHAYVESNIVAFTNILEACRHTAVGHLVYASSSSVYGANVALPFSVDQNVDHPLSIYAATKKAGELMAHTYSHLFGLPTTGLRFFTVYGPWGRPDMALFLFSKAILDGTPIDVFNNGDMRRDFTYVDDIVEGVVRLTDLVPQANPEDRGDSPARSKAPYRLYNIGNSRPEELTRVIELLERELGRRAIVRLRPMQPGDVPVTFADTDDIERDVGFRPSTPIEEGIRRFVAWYAAYHAAQPALAVAP